mgnify:CR=1 FL=1
MRAHGVLRRLTHTLPEYEVRESESASLREPCPVTWVLGTTVRVRLMT